MSERIERWVNVYSDGSLGTFWDSPPQTLPHARVAHFVEIRDGESIAVNGETDGPPLVSGVDPASGKDGAVVVTMAPRSLVDDARKERDAAIERAEKAERERDHAQNCLRVLEEGVDSEAAKFEREQAGRIFGRKFVTNGGMKGTYTLHEAIHAAKELRSHYFPPAKEVSNG